MWKVSLIGMSKLVTCASICMGFVVKCTNIQYVPGHLNSRNLINVESCVYYDNSDYNESDTMYLNSVSSNITYDTTKNVEKWSSKIYP